MSHTTNIVFDFGAVLFTWRPAELVQDHFPQHADTAERASQLGRSIFSHDDWHNFDRGSLAMDEVVNRTAKRLALPAPVLESLVSRIGELLTPMADTVAVLNDLRRRRHAQGNLRLYFLSNMPAPYARTLEQRHDFLQWFDGGIYSGDVKLIKPDPAIYRALEERYALEPQHTVFIDDLKANIAAAEERGWRGIHFESPAQLAAAIELL